MRRWIWGAFLIAGDLTFHLIGLCCNRRWLDHTSSLSLGCNHCHRCNARELFTIFARNDSKSRTFGSMLICKSWHHYYHLHSIYNLGYQTPNGVLPDKSFTVDAWFDLFGEFSAKYGWEGYPWKDHEKCISDLGSIGLPSQNLPQARCWCYVATSVRPCPFSLVHQGLATTTVSHFLDQDLFSMQASVAFSVRLLGSLVLLVCWCVWGCDWWRWVVSVVHNNNGAAPVRNAYVISVYILPSVCLI